MRRAYPVAAALLASATPLWAAAPAELVGQLNSLGREGADNARAAAAWRELAAAGPKALIDIARNLDNRKPHSANWLRSCADAIAGKARLAGEPLPAAELEAVALDRTQKAAGRRLAYEMLCLADPKAPERLLPNMLDDTAAELRRDAIAARLPADSEPADPAARKELVAKLRPLFDAARDTDQVQDIAKRLTKLGEKPDTASHFGFKAKFQLLSSFDNTGGKGWAAKFGPEGQPGAPDLSATYPGKDGKPAAWQPAATADPNGQVDLTKIVGKVKNAVAYAYLAVESDGGRPIQLRIGSPNAPKIYLNGRELYSREEYHFGMDQDQHVAEGDLQAGVNHVLIKLCQNDQKEVWAQAWAFQCRVTDHLGGAVPVKNVTPGSDPKPDDKPQEEKK